MQKYMLFLIYIKTTKRNSLNQAGYTLQLMRCFTLAFRSRDTP